MRIGALRKRKERWIPALIPLLFGIALLVVSPLHDTFEEWDGVVQAFAGMEIVSGKGYTWGVSQRWPPLYPLLIGLGSRLVSVFDAAKAVSMIAAVGLVYVIYVLTVEISGRQSVGLLAQAFLAVNPRFVLSSIQAENHMLESVFLVLALTLFLKAARSPDGKLWLAAGATAGLASLTRYTSYALLPVFVVAPFVLFDRKRALRAVLLLVAAFALVNLPWWYANARANGSPFANRLYITVGWSVLSDFSSHRWWWDTHTDYHSLLDIFRANPIGYLMNTLRTLRSCGRVLLTTGGVLAPFVAPALFHAVIALPWRQWSVLLAATALYVLGVSQALVLDEYLLGFTVVLGILSVLFMAYYGARLVSVYPSLAKFRVPAAVLAALLAGGLLLTSLTVYRYVKADDYDNGQMVDYRAITTVLKSRDPDLSRKFVMALHPARAYYLGSGYLPAPLYYEGTVDGLVAYRGVKHQVEMLNMRFPSATPLEQARADYLIYDVGLRSHLPQFAFLFDPTSDQIPENFRLVYQSRNAVVYEILWNQPEIPTPTDN